MALSIYFKNFLDLWGVLPHVQSAPPIFMTICKILNSIYQYLPEYFLRLFPFISSIVAIFFFYKLTTKFLESKSAILIANLFFAINTQLIYFAHEFKQYSTDTAVVLGCLLYLSNTNLAEMTKKKLVILSIIITVLPFLSLPSLFVIAGWILLQIMNKRSIKTISFITLPAIFANVLYYIITLRPAREIMLDSFDFLWKEGFLNFSFDSVFSIINGNLSFYFSQCKYTIIPFLLLLFGIVIMLRRRLSIDKLVLYTLLFTIIASFLKIYPIKSRVSLYLLPIVIFIMAVPISVFKNKIVKLVNIIAFCLLFGSFSRYNIIIKDYEDASTMMQILNANYKKGEYVFYNDISDSQFDVYSYIYNFHIPDNLCGKVQLTDYGESWYYSVLDTLPKNNRYWFYYAYDLDTKPVIPLLKNWVHKNGKILFEKDFNRKSYLLYLEL